MSETLYRKYRSKKLADVVGQQHITDILIRALERGHIAHAYLLTGPRGVGKTSVARILAHEINELPYEDETSHLDIVEIDAASNNSVEDIRDLREKVRIAPVSARKKIYIIDEVHMLSKAAFNALLKTLEEPPEHIVFILATTDLDKLPDTIISRTQRFGFRAITAKDATAHLKFIAKTEKIAIDDTALALIAEHGDGSFRDSIGLLDQLRSLVDPKETITSTMVEQALGLAAHDLVTSLLATVTAGDLKKLLSLLDTAANHGTPSVLLAQQIAKQVRATVTTSPQLIPLLDSLLDVAKSSDPDTKLLTVLASHMTDKPKTAALEATVAPIHELEVAASSPHPADVLTQSVTPPAAATPVAKVVQPKQRTKTTKNTEFSWPTLVATAKGRFVAIYSVLNKCSGELQDDVLTIYARNAFYKKKLDDPKYRLNLSECLELIGMHDCRVETVPSVAPPKDSQTAAVAAIMGGGEEVEL